MDDDGFGREERRRAERDIVPIGTLDVIVRQLEIVGRRGVKSFAVFGLCMCRDQR